MGRVLLTAVTGVAALMFAALPAQGQEYGSRTRSPDSFRSMHGGRGMDRCRGDDRFQCSGFGGGWAYADGEWAKYNNRSWNPDSFNDWWNDRPDRAYPRWVREQHRRGTCDPDRMWWSGDGWHC